MVANNELFHESRYVIEDDYFPEIALPGQVTKLEPMCASCYPFGEAGEKFTSSIGKGIWDPAIVLADTRSLAAATISVHGENRAYATVPALPGLVPPHLNSPTTKNMADSVGSSRERVLFCHRILLANLTAMDLATILDWSRMLGRNQAAMTNLLPPL